MPVLDSNVVSESHGPFLSRRFDIALHFAAGLHQRQVRKGTILGLLATVSNQPDRRTAEAVEDSEFASVDRNRVIGLLHRRTDFWLQGVTAIKDEMI